MKSKPVSLIIIIAIVGSTFVIAFPVHASNGVITVAPSGDTTGVTDADNIETALESVSPGGTVELSAGQFYISRPIYTEDFNGTLQGAGQGATIIEAVRKSEDPGDGFARATNPFPFTVPVMLWFWNPVKALAITDLTLQVDHPNPCDPAPGTFWPFTAINCGIYIERGSACETVILDVQIQGADGGDFRGKNLGYGVFRSGYTPYGFPDSEGHTIIQNCVVEDNGAPGIVFGGYSDSFVTIQDNTIMDCGMGIFTYASPSCEISIVANAIVRAYAWGGMKIAGCFDGDIRIEDNLIVEFQAVEPDETPIRLDNSNNVLIRGNVFIDVYNPDGHIDAVIYLRYGPTNCIIRDNDYTESGVAGGVEIHPDWDPTNINSRKFVNPICVWLSQWTADNLVFESGNFPVGMGGARNQIVDEGINNRVVGHRADDVADPGLN